MYKGQFQMFEDNNEHNYTEVATGNCYWYVEELNEWHLYQDKYKGYTMSSGKRCNSLRAFRRNLKRMAKKQPELIGIEFRLVNRWSIVSKKGNRYGLDTVMKVR